MELTVKDRVIYIIIAFVCAGLIALIVSLSILLVQNGPFIPNVPQNQPDIQKGVNAYYLYACSSVYQDEVFSALKNYNYSIVRVFMVKLNEEGYPGECDSLSDIETGFGEFSNETSGRLVQFLDRALLYNISVILTLHDSYSLGCWRKDVYQNAFSIPYKLPFGSFCNDEYNSLSNFYQNTAARIALKNRFRYILSLPTNNGIIAQHSAIHSFAYQNEPQYYKNYASDWDCDMARYLQSLTSIPISSGGSVNVQIALCPSIKYLTFHSYQSYTPFVISLYGIIELAKRSGKIVLLEEFDRSDFNLFQLKKITASRLGVSWLFWHFDARNKSSSLWIKDL